MFLHGGGRVVGLGRVTGVEAGSGGAGGGSGGVGGVSFKESPEERKISRMG